MSELVSILIPTYNAEKWIAGTIKSALDQTWPKKEIIVIDDGSSDNTLQIARSFESDVLKVETQANSGAPAARNKALSYAQGDYIQWLDHDDLLAPDKISEQLKHRDAVQNKRILFSASFGRFFYCPDRAKFIRNSLWRDLTPSEYFLSKFNEDVWFQPGAWLVSRELTEMAGPYFEIRSPDDDGEYFCRVVSNCEKILFVPESIAYWRVGHSGSLSQNRSDRALSALFISTSRTIEHLLALEDSEKTRAACLKYLQHRLSNFYPEKREFVEKFEKIAQSLGGHLEPPEVGWKLLLFKTIFGWKAAKLIKNLAWRSENSVLRNWDKLIYELTHGRKSPILPS